MYVLKLSLGDFDFDFLFFFTTFLGSAAAAGAATATAAAATSFLARAVFLVEVGMIVLLFGWLRRTLTWSNVQVTTKLCELWHSDILWCTWICVVGVGGGEHCCQHWQLTYSYWELDLVPMLVLLHVKLPRQVAW